eukprot:366199-Chlamydomonas_euryale.AAC.2
MCRASGCGGVFSCPTLPARRLQRCHGLPLPRARRRAPIPAGVGSATRDNAPPPSHPSTASSMRAAGGLALLPPAVRTVRRPHTHPALHAQHSFPAAPRSYVIRAARRQSDGYARRPRLAPRPRGRGSRGGPPTGHRCRSARRQGRVRSRAPGGCHGKPRCRAGRNKGS